MNQYEIVIEQIKTILKATDLAQSGLTKQDFINLNSLMQDLIEQQEVSKLSQE